MQRTETDERPNRELPRPEPGAAPRPRVPEPRRFRLDNGLRVVAVPWGRLPQIVLKLVLPLGAAADPADLPGAAALLGRAITEGTELLTADDLNTRLDRLGANLDVHVGHDFTEVELFLLSETLAEALPLFAEVVTRPRLPPREVERVRQETLDALAARRDEPANVADDRTLEAIFGAAHPYGRPSVGTVEGVQELSLESLRDLHETGFRPGGACVVVAGDVRADEVADQLEHALRDWTGAGLLAGAPPPPPTPAAAGQLLRFGWPDAQQAELRIGGTGLPRSSPDWIPAAVANYILGGSTITGRLGANLREDKGWTYGARSGFSAARQAGGWVADTAVDVDVREAAMEEMMREVRRLREEPVPPEELRRAQEAMVLSLPRAFETPGRVASRLVTLEVFGLPNDYWSRFPDAVRAVTAADVLAMATRYFDPELLVRVELG